MVMIGRMRSSEGRFTRGRPAAVAGIRWFQTAGLTAWTVCASSLSAGSAAPSSAADETAVEDDSIVHNNRAESSGAASMAARLTHAIA